MTFAEIGLHSAILQALNEAGYDEPTPVQRQAIPVALAGNDLLVSSQTGSGKTAAFMLPGLHRVAAESSPTAVASSPERGVKTRPNQRRARHTVAQPQILVLTPTRELALQVTAATEKYARRLAHLRAVAVVGGMAYARQIEQLGRNPEIVIATPGRLIDHITARRIDCSQIRLLVLDEADRMLDMGFIDDIERIVAATPVSRQTMLFSATLDGVVGELAQRLTRAARRIEVAPVAAKDGHIEQRLHFVDDLAHKNRLLDHLLRDAAIEQALVFTATRRDADSVSDRLNLAGLNAAALHGDMHQGARNRTLAAMRRGELRILVATDVAARGIDVPTITHVFNYDLPKFAEDYVHRIGRTGRAGRNGLAISLAHHGEHFSVRKIERFTKRPIAVEVVAGHEPTRRPPAMKPQPAEKKATGHGKMPPRAGRKGVPGGQRGRVTAGGR